MALKQTKQSKSGSVPSTLSKKGRIGAFCKRIASAVGRLPVKAIWHRFLRGFRRALPSLILLSCVFAFLIGACFAVSAAVWAKTRDRVFSPDAIPSDRSYDCIVVLGCAVYSDGRLSHMLEDRVQTAVRLYHSGAADKILMSGDSHAAGYDETGAMARRAIELGVPEEAILTDPWGLSTFESVTRARSQFDLRRVLIVTQEYHLFRALYIAQKSGLEADGAIADLRPYRGQARYDLREVFARCKDVFFTEKYAYSLL